MFEHWENQNSRRLDLFDDYEAAPEGTLRRVVAAVETAALAGSISLLTATVSIWFVETFLR